MKPIQVAACCLIASAVVLSGLLVARLSQRSAANEAHADMVISRDQFTLLTAQTRAGEESLFVLDNQSASLLIYRLNVARDIIEPLGGIRLEQLFGNVGGDDRRRGR